MTRDDEWNSYLRQKKKRDSDNFTRTLWLLVLLMLVAALLFYYSKDDWDWLSKRFEETIVPYGYEQSQSVKLAP